MRRLIHGRREDFFQWGPLGNFSRGRPKVVKFDFSHWKLRKQHFVAESLKIHGGPWPPYHPSYAHIYVMYVNVWELIIAFPNGGQWSPFSKVCPPWLNPLVTPLLITLSSQNYCLPGPDKLLERLYTAKSAKA